MFVKARGVLKRTAREPRGSLVLRKPPSALMKIFHFTNLSPLKAERRSGEECYKATTSAYSVAGKTR